MSANKDAQTWVVIPVFNESTVLRSVLSGALAEFTHIVVVDDGSSDDSAAIAAALPVHLLRHPVNLGQGAALQTGISYALSRGAAWIGTFDSDGQMDPADLVRMSASLRESGADVCLGTRFAGGTVTGIPFFRKLALETAVRLSRLAFGSGHTDVHNGLRVFSRRAAETIQIRADGMAHATDIVRQIEHHRLRWIEAPVTIRYTGYSLKKGQRTLNAFNILWDLLFG